MDFGYGPVTATNMGLMTAAAFANLGALPSTGILGTANGGTGATTLLGAGIAVLTPVGATTATAQTITNQGTADTGTSPLGVINGRIGASTTVATRPVWQLQNNGTVPTTYYPTGMWEVTGTVRAIGSTVPTSGSGAEMSYFSGAAYVGAYNRGVNYTPLHLQGLTVALEPGGTATFTASSTVNTSTLPIQLKSYTVATLPASPAAGLVAYASNAAVAPCLCFGDGSVWKRCDNAATTVI